MAPKAKDAEKEGSKKEGPKQKSCGVNGPGPKYKLKTVVGYDDHCHSKLRNPAYSIAYKQTGGNRTCGPGPQYMYELSRKPGFSIGARWTSTGIKCSPGPYKYDIPTCTPKFSIKSRTPNRSGNKTPGPYSLPDKISGPAFIIGMRPDRAECKPSPGPYAPYRIDTIKPRIPTFVIGNKQTSNFKSLGPGPIYLPVLLKKSPGFSFGIKHSECSSPFITECDEKC
ncbi:outer dense fiber protein 3-like [Belonocnema kinseyi]|uniref:outer dense fiber protein 3-like n=1 Tax=Belonocnema kinseyi TaxID=2817044 RepID=UPI00143E0C2C|nr:outer dense fiber protein 3-like [Belonocnema kinseyi]